MLDPSVAQLDRDGDWQALTALREKFLLLAVDTAFRESWRAAVEVLGQRALETLQRIAAVTVRPEAVLSGQVAACIQYLTRHDFALISSRQFRYTRRTIREVWRYQWNVASLDSMEISDLVHRKAPAFLLFLLDRTPTPAIPAICRFTDLKGTSAPSGRTARHLRSVLGAPNRILVMVHAPDEPMDLVRELGVLFGQKALAQIYRRLGEACAGSPTAPRDGLVIPSRALNLWERNALPSPAPLRVEGAVAEFCRTMATRRESQDPRIRAAAGRAAEQVLAARAGTHLDWRRWSRDLAAADPPVDAWSHLLIGSQYVEHSVPGATPVFPETGRRRWMAGEGRLLVQSARADGLSRPL